MESYGRIYSIWDKVLRKFVYVGQTVRHQDLKPHGQWVRRAWNKYPLRFVYCFEREWPSIQRQQLNAFEVRFVLRRKTFNGLNNNGMNLTTGGRSSGKLADVCRNNPVLNRKRSINATKQHCNPEFKSRHRIAVAAAMANPTIKSRQQTALQPIWKSQSYREKVSAIQMRDLPRRIASGKRLAQLRRDPEFQTKLARSLKIRWQDPVIRAKGAERIKEIVARPEVVSKIRDSALRQWASQRNTMVAAIQNASGKISSGTKNAFMVNGRGGFRLMTLEERKLQHRLSDNKRYRTSIGDSAGAAEFERQLIELKNSRKLQR